MATEEACRNVIWSYDAGRITLVDLISFGFLLVNGTNCKLNTQVSQGLTINNDDL